MKANGFTIIELMVGVVISMLCMIMMLMFFKQLSHISLSSSQDAEYDAQLKTGMLVIEKLVQNAGYGSGQLSDIATGTHYGNPAVFWRFIPDLSATPVSYQCHGVAEQVVSDGAQKTHRLVILKKTNCGTSTAVNEGNWEEYQPIVSVKNTSATPLFEYSIAQGDCRPYGIDKDNAGVRQLTLTAPRQHGTDLGQNIKTTVCLNNIKVV
jgi:Tfp pilus assembly protein PilW